ncbi:MAG: dTDP-4-dehydrorhamnose 3,5-epimerase family protein, partial [Planctomycetota bacterium]
MKIVRELFPGTFVLEYNVFKDNRGLTTAPFHELNFIRCIGHGFSISQTLLSESLANCLRGMHYQNNSAPISKIVSCLSGKIQDVVIDLRQKSSTFGQWASVELCHNDAFQIYIPVGVAHGYLTLSDSSLVFYLQEGFYDPEAS